LVLITLSLDFNEHSFIRPQLSDPVLQLNEFHCFGYPPRRMELCASNRQSAESPEATLRCEASVKCNLFAKTESAQKLE
jgi:hypothetical protein